MKKQFVLFNKVVSELGQSKKRISKQSLASGKVRFVALKDSIAGRETAKTNTEISAFPAHVRNHKGSSMARIE